MHQYLQFLQQELQDPSIDPEERKSLRTTFHSELKNFIGTVKNRKRPPSINIENEESTPKTNRRSMGMPPPRFLNLDSDSPHTSSSNTNSSIGE